MRGRDSFDGGTPARFYLVAGLLPVIVHDYASERPMPAGQAPAECFTLAHTVAAIDLIRGRQDENRIAVEV